MVEQLLPLMNHAQRAIVEQEHLHGGVVDGRGRHFLAVHLE